METNFNFKSQVCTNKVQSERLLALGLKKETADMLIMSYSTEHDIIALPWSESGGWTRDNSTPAWSLHRLLMMTTSKRKVMIIRYESDLFDVVIKKIEHEIKEGYFNKEYLV